MLTEIAISIILAKCFEILRQPGEILSFWNRLFIGWDDDVDELPYPKGLPFVFSFFYFIAYIGLHLKMFFYKVFTCSLCHSGYVAIYFIFKGTDFIILPTVLVSFHFLQTVIYRGND
jgi:hypothetical protein